MSSFHLQIVTPDGLFYDGEAESLDVRAVTGGVELRVIAAECPAPDARREEATLEDVFFYDFGEKAGVEDDTL